MNANASPNFFDTTGLSEKQQACYGLAMIGFDSVINSRLGLISDHVFNLVDKFVDDEPIADKDIPLVKVVLGAYMWKHSPHAYAIKTYGDCVSH